MQGLFIHGIKGSCDQCVWTSAHVDQSGTCTVIPTQRQQHLTTYRTQTARSQSASSASKRYAGTLRCFTSMTTSSSMSASSPLCRKNHKKNGIPRWSQTQRRRIHRERVYLSNCLEYTRCASHSCLHDFHSEDMQTSLLCFLLPAIHTTCSLLFSWNCQHKHKKCSHASYIPNNSEHTTLTSDLIFIHSSRERGSRGASGVSVNTSSVSSDAEKLEPSMKRGGGWLEDASKGADAGTTAGDVSAGRGLGSSATLLEDAPSVSLELFSSAGRISVASVSLLLASAGGDACS